MVVCGFELVQNPDDNLVIGSVSISAGDLYDVMV